MLWQLLSKYGCPEKFTTMIESLHTGMMANVCLGGEVWDSFSATNGVKQGGVLSPTLFSFLLSAMLDHAFRDMGMASTYSPDRALINVAHFTEKTKTTWLLVREMQTIVDAFSDASKKFGQTINIKKTEFLHQPNLTRTREEDIMVGGNKLNSVLEFNYLGSIISSNKCIDNEIQRKMSKVSASFGRLRPSTLE